ncbi:MAG TPA: hypothetical protein VGB55_11690, partial [Tepidisphaeraceae bacterium]
MKPLDYERSKHDPTAASIKRLERWVLASAIVTTPLIHWPLALLVGSSALWGTGRVNLVLLLFTPIFFAIAFLICSAYQIIYVWGKKSDP